MKLRLENVGHAFLGRTVIEGIDLALAAGEIVALVGPSGCGKTTLMHIAAGLVVPLRGRVHRAYRRHAMVFQEPRLLPWLTARDNIAYGLACAGTPRRHRREIAAVRAREVGLEADDLDKFPPELSGGMRQRAAVARALAVAPDVVFLDEPFSAVDAGLRRMMQDHLAQAAAREGFCALFVTHDLGEAARIADRLVVLSARRRGIIDLRAIPGRPGARDERFVFDLVAAWSCEEAFAEILDGAGRLQ
ncbi:ABC-type nitrate/sulfonate/bicarbonate transport system, ATPase component [Chelatococcus sambhunathii]|uniref:ABC-type nitrate/sulfonate/bicarbonate transport system, ATPase component n=1 Tax=Chelatococcus sambhunathii TaxID=363953 RepID=A0ABP2A1H5_9HYPH|nr:MULTISPECIES: ATP-binding cassette domain-containing protein [Chelatococcus]CUA86889.1 ABC-type nitrate/sulfonate/bicarbonate transport system, ATPase component [Chelatococcus sambhunathii]